MPQAQKLVFVFLTLTFDWMVIVMLVCFGYSERIQDCGGGHVFAWCTNHKHFSVLTLFGDLGDRTPVTLVKTESSHREGL